MSAELCLCGHERSAHYVYCNNGRDQGRCRECDPYRKNNVRSSLVVVTIGSEFWKQDQAADHEFRLNVN